MNPDNDLPVLLSTSPYRIHDTVVPPDGMPSEQKMILLEQHGIRFIPWVIAVTDFEKEFWKPDCSVLDRISDPEGRHLAQYARYEMYIPYCTEQSGHFNDKYRRERLPRPYHRYTVVDAVYEDLRELYRLWQFVEDTARRCPVGIAYWGVRLALLRQVYPAFNFVAP
jgi:hypothetical protein